VNALKCLIGKSPAMELLRSQVVRVATTPLSVLIQGPTGAGKELVARAIHEESNRRGRFVAFNVGAIGESMFEDALFGHVRGAFTGASADSPGYLREAHQGTVFMDEVSRLRPSAQVSLLRALETREFRPVGGREDRYSDFRIVSATNENLRELVEIAEFRADLLHRLRTVTLSVPALSQRGVDVLMLARHFTAQSAPAEHAVELTPAARKLLLAYHWPGNVRELRNVMEAAVAMSDSHLIDRPLLMSILGLSPNEVMAILAENTHTAALRHSLSEVAWDIDAAAVRLGVHRATVYRWIQRYGIEVPSGVLRRRIEPSPLETT
jgi:DNA-binding NtrC family response regulator